MDRAAMRERRRLRWVGRAERARDAFGLVFALVILSYVLSSLLSNRGWPSVITLLATSATSVVALASSHVEHGRVRLAMTVSGISLAFAVVGAASDARIWLNLASLIQIALLTAAMAAVLMRVVSTLEVSSRTILGALSFYTVLGLLFTYVYAVVDRFQGGEFFEGVAHPSGGDFIFFSYTTLTTTGYGDLVPAGQPGRMLSGLEMMVGQIFLVTLVAGLVAMWRPGQGVRQRLEKRRRNGKAGDGETAEGAEGAGPDPA
jgi:hypothetical protein